VKSVGGEARDALWLEGRGVRGDRAWAVRDAAGKLGSGKTTRRFRYLDGLLEFRSAYPHAGDADVPHLDADPVHLLGHASLACRRGALPNSNIAPERFRPDVPLSTQDATSPERGCLGSRLRSGAADLLVREPTVPCAMVSAPQGALPRDPGILRALAQRCDACFGFYADVIVPGAVRLGDAVERID